MGRCKHDWAVQSDTVLPSPIEQMGPLKSLGSAQLWAFQKKHIVIRTCEICGKIEERVNTLYDLE